MILEVDLPAQKMQTTFEQAKSFVRKWGVVLASANGPVPKLTESIVRESIRGSWWAHPKSHEIFNVLQRLSDTPEILVCRLVEGKLTLVHRRLWPALACVAHHFPARYVAQVHEEHTDAGHHITRDVVFPDWVPTAVIKKARKLEEVDAFRALGDWATRQAKLRKATFSKQ
jgi:hypothetical protein